jgi:hypothetical protein
VKLWFSSLPPAGVEFAVTVKINGDVWGTYPFTSWFDPAGVEVSVAQYNTESWDADPWAKFLLTGPVGTQRACEAVVLVAASGWGGVCGDGQDQR